MRSGSPEVSPGIRGPLDAVSLIYMDAGAEARSGETGRALVHRVEKRKALGTRVCRDAGAKGACLAKIRAQKKPPGALGDIRGYMHCGSKGEIRTLDAAGMNRML